MLPPVNATVRVEVKPVLCMDKIVDEQKKKNNKERINEGSDSAVTIIQAISSRGSVTDFGIFT